MKAILATMSLAVIFGLASSAPAAADQEPARQYKVESKWIGVHRHRVRVYRPVSQAEPYALTGERAEPQAYRWERKQKWIGGARDMRTVYVRVPVE